MTSALACMSSFALCFVVFAAPLAVGNRVKGRRIRVWCNNSAQRTVDAPSNIRYIDSIAVRHLGTIVSIVVTKLPPTGGDRSELTSHLRDAGGSGVPAASMT